ncbi:hypothetical protein ABIB95_003577 [Bradyrhizobium sp. LA2.1]
MIATSHTDLDVGADVEGPEQQQHHAGSEIGQRAL